MGYPREEILHRLKFQQPSTSFQSGYAYTNFGLSAAAVAGKTWEDLSEERLYRPLGMTSTSSRQKDFLAHENRARGHVLMDGKWVPNTSATRRRKVRREESVRRSMIWPNGCASSSTTAASRGRRLWRRPRSRSRTVRTFLRVSIRLTGCRFSTVSAGYFGSRDEFRNRENSMRREAPPSRRRG